MTLSRLINKKTYKMSSIFRVVRIDGYIPALEPNSFSKIKIDIDAEYFRLINLRITYSGNQIPNNAEDLKFNFWINELNTDDITSSLGDYTVFSDFNVVLPYLRDDLNVFVVNKNMSENIKQELDYTYLIIQNLNDIMIDELFVSLVVERLSKGY